MRKQIRNRPARSDRRRRAHWWFAQMRRVVDLALPSQAMASPRPEQIYMRLK